MHGGWTERVYIRDQGHLVRKDGDWKGPQRDETGVRSWRERAQKQKRVATNRDGGWRRGGAECHGDDCGMRDDDRNGGWRAGEGWDIETRR